MIIEQIEGGRIIDCRSDDNCLFRDYRPLQPLSDSLPHSEMVEPRRSWIALSFSARAEPPCPHFPLFRRRQPVPHQGVKHLDREAMRQHDRLGGPVRRSGEQP
jgi:hypothetical protein